MICGPPATPFPKGLAFSRMAKAISQMVWHFRAWRKLFPKWFGVSALGETCFPNSLMFPHTLELIAYRLCKAYAIENKL